MPPRYFTPATGFADRVRNEMDAQGRPARAGLDRLGGRRGGRGGQQSAVEQPLPDAETTGAAKLLVLSVTGDSLASGGDHVAFDAIVAQHGFEGVVTAQDGHWVHPVAGVYVLTYEHSWATYTGNAAVGVEIDGAMIPEGTLADGNTGGASGRGTVCYVTEAGTVGRIKVTQWSGSAQTCDALVRVAITDPGNYVAWERVFAADAYGITHDGASWWTTSAAGSLDVYERDATGAVISSFTVGAPFTSQVRGITFDGVDIWLTGAGSSDEPVARYSTAGVLLSSFATGPVADGNNGLAWDGTNLWLFENNGDDVEEWTTGGAMLSTFALVGTFGDLAYHNGRIYAVNVDAPELHVLSTSGTLIDTIDLSAVPGTPYGVYIASDGTLYIGGSDGVYRRTGAPL